MDDQTFIALIDISKSSTVKRSSENYHLYDILVEMDLVRKIEKNTYSIKSEGSLVSRHGSWLKYQEYVIKTSIEKEKARG